MNDAPVVDLNAGGAGQDVTTAFTEQTVVLIAPAGTLTDVDSANMTSLTVTLTARPDGNAVESLSLNGAATAAAAGLTVSYTAGTGVLSITGSAAKATYQTILQGIQYNDTSDTPTTTNRSITVVANDGTTASATQTVTLTVAAVNDAPVAVITPLTYAATEQTSLVLHGTGLSVSDVDAGGASNIVATLSVVEGTLTVAAGTSGVTVAGSGTGSVTLTGTVAQINALLASAGGAAGTISYIDNTDTPSASTVLTLSVNDAGNTGTGGALAGSDTATINITAVNDAPVVDLNAGGAGQDVTTAFTEQTVVLIAPAATLTDVDSANMTSLTVTLTARPDGNAVESLSLNGAATAAAAGLTVSYTAGTGVLSITGSAAKATYQTILQGIQYNDTSDTPTTTNRSITVVANDGTTVSATQTVTLTVAAVNDAPVVDLNAGGAGNNVTTAFTEQTPVLIAPVGTLTDVDSANLTSLTVTLTARPDGNAVESLSLNAAATAAAAGLTVSYTQASGVLSITGSATTATYQTMLQGILYNDTSDTPTTSNRSISVVANDGAVNSATQTVTLTVAAVNDAPVATITPLTYAATEQTTLTLHGTGLSVSDVDAGGASNIVATLSVVEGTLTVAAGSSGVTVGGSGTGSVTLTGTVAQINALLASAGGATGTITYIDNTDTPSASTVLTLSVNDAGNTGTGGALVGSDTATINITAVNDAPVVDLNAGGAGQDVTTAFTEQTPVLIAPVATLTDVDSANLTALTVTLTARPDGNAVESLALNAAATTAASGAGLTVSYTAGTGVLSITGSATKAVYQSILQGILYNDTSDTPTTSNRAITVVANDGATPSATQTVTLTVAAVNDAPVVDLNAGGAGQDVTTAFTEQTPVLIAPAGTLADVDSANLTSLTVTLTTRPDGNAVESLALNAAATTAAGGLTVSYTAATGVLSITGSATKATYQTILQGIQYNDTSDTPTTTNRSITVVANDGTTASATQTVTLTVAAVNDAPVAVITPLTYAATEQTSLVLHGTGLSVSDVDAGGASNIVATLSVVEGTLTVAAGTSGVTVGGSGTGSVTLTGTVAQINALLASAGGGGGGRSATSTTPIRRARARC